MTWNILRCTTQGFPRKFGGLWLDPTLTTARVLQDRLPNVDVNLIVPHETIPRARYRGTRRIAIIPGYLFVKNGDKWWGEISSIPGIRGWVEVGGRLATVPESTAADLRLLSSVVEMRREAAQASTHRRPRSGDRVRVRRPHLLEGREIVLKHVRGARALFDLLGHEASIDVDALEVA